VARTPKELDTPAPGDDQQQDILSLLGLTPTNVPALPPRARKALIAYLLRWEHYDAAHDCLSRLLVTHSHLVSLYDDLVRVSLAQGEPERALEIVQRRQALKTSTISRSLEARVRLATNDASSARCIARQLMAEHPQMLRSWRLQAHLCLATGDLKGAEAALIQLEMLRPESAYTAQQLARRWQAEGDLDKALLWARTALSRSERDERRPSVELLRLLEDLYQATGQTAQAQSTAARLRQRRESETEALRQTLGLSRSRAAIDPWPQARAAQDAVGIPWDADVTTDAPEPTAEEQARLNAALRRHFAHGAFRPGQANVLAAVLRGDSVLAVMPTGSGKSLCYQLAALLLPGTTLVVSPLIALMKDQLDGLPPAVAQRATTLNSTLDGGELSARLTLASKGEYKLLYVAPERLRQRPFLHALKSADVSLLVVDEAHCVSLWGHDFRPDYRFISRAWRDLGQPPILAMTATATPRVRDDIQATLGEMHSVTTEVHRPNLLLEARSFENDADKKQALLALCRQIEGSGIVYANSRAKCEQLAVMLRRNGISAVHYHAGIEDRAAAQDRFMRNEARVVVATVAFGMGVDKPDVRFIIHYNPPRALENYFQEAGRAGRDGLPARCILFHASYDKRNLTRWSRQDALHRTFLREVYAAIRNRLGPQRVGLVAMADLERDLVADAVHLRVAVHFLETAGLLCRDFDLPCTATLTLLPGAPLEPYSGSSDAASLAFARFVESARLRPNQTVSRDLVALSRDCGLGLRDVESELLGWDAAGWLRYRGIGRDMLLALPDPPLDSRQRVAAMVAEYCAGQDARIAEMMAYATTDRCRHGHISAYFGGRPIQRCESCDNCLGIASSAAQAHDEAQPIQERSALQESAYVLLEAVDQLPFPLGATGLARALQGAGSSPVQADRFPCFGALAGCTQKAIRECASQLVHQGLLEHFQKGRYRLLRLTDAGRSWLGARHLDKDSLGS
jgi:ATP-dependent DNA helicase RecQ